MHSAGKGAQMEPLIHLTCIADDPAIASRNCWATERGGSTAPAIAEVQDQRNLRIVDEGGNSDCLNWSPARDFADRERILSVQSRWW